MTDEQHERMGPQFVTRIATTPHVAPVAFRAALVKELGITDQLTKDAISAELQLAYRQGRANPGIGVDKAAERLDLAPEAMIERSTTWGASFS